VHNCTGLLYTNDHTVDLFIPASPLAHDLSIGYNLTMATMWQSVGTFWLLHNLMGTQHRGSVSLTNMFYVWLYYILKESFFNKYWFYEKIRTNNDLRFLKKYSEIGLAVEISK
jgi:hypothetical protein